MSISRKVAFLATAGFQLRATVAAVSDRRKRDQQRPAVRDRRYRSVTSKDRRSETAATEARPEKTGGRRPPLQKRDQQRPAVRDRRYRSATSKDRRSETAATEA